VAILEHDHQAWRTCLSVGRIACRANLQGTSLPDGSPLAAGCRAVVGADRRTAASTIPPSSTGPAALAEGRARRGLGDPNIEHFLFDRPDADLAGGPGSPRRPQLLLARLRRAGRHLAHDGGHGAHGIRGTVALNSDVCNEYPRIIEEGNKLGWEWMGHGTTNSILLNSQSEARSAR
jgi:hypothetical protein